MNYLAIPSATRRLVPVLFLLLFFSSGCKKDQPVDPLSRRTLLTGTSWKITKALDISSTPASPVDITQQMPMGFATFSQDGKFSSANITGTWEFSEGETKITLNSSAFGGLPVSAEILELTESLMHLKMTFILPDRQQLLDVTFASFTTDFSPEVNFEQIWKEFDSRYSFFAVKNINWDSVYSFYRPQVKNNTLGGELFQIMSNMLNTLKDGHVNLYTPYGTFAYSDWYTKYPQNFISTEAVSKYLSHDYGTLAQGYMRYGKINNNIGYIYIGPNLMGSDAEWSQAMDRIIDSLKDTKGIVVDIRNNGGGSEGLGQIVASRFYDKSRTYNYISWRSGPGHTNFTKPSPSQLQPSGKQIYLKPVALLTNRHCFSSAEGTILMFRVLPNVTTIGDTTGGGSGNPITLMLPNGWSYRLSRWIQYTADMEIFEGKGLAPKIPVSISEADFNAGKDAILEYAVTYLTNK